MRSRFSAGEGGHRWKNNILWKKLQPTLMRSRLKWTVANLSHPLRYPDTLMKVNAEFVDPDQIPSCVMLGGGRTCERADDDVTADRSRKQILVRTDLLAQAQDGASQMNTEPNDLRRKASPVSKSVT